MSASHDVSFKQAADAIAGAYRALGWTVRVYTKPKNQGFTVDAWA